MEKKVYEGYKKTATGAKNATAAKTSASKASSAPKKNDVAPNKTTKKTSSKPNAKPVSKISTSKPTIAMFVDVDNVGISRENLMEILFYANGKYQIQLCKLYGFSDETLPGIREIANEYNVVTVGKLKFKQPGVNCLDSRLLVDAYECAVNNKGKIDMIFVWCYPCDLSDLFEKIVALGINTATINNNIFDCKNKFVSQTFKLYSPYNFNVEQSTYGKVNNTTINTAPNLDSTPLSVEMSTATTSTPKIKPAEPTPEVSPSAAQPETIDGVIPPVLPRRFVLERHNPNAPKPEPEPMPIDEETDELKDEQNDERASSVVEDIARKLNLQMPGMDNLPDVDDDNEESDTNETSGSFLDALKQAGFGDLLGEKSSKYEDTIGDL